MDEAEVRKLQVEAWKTTVGVQQHFNDIEMKIRALAITVLTAVLAAAAVAARDGTTLDIGGVAINLGGAILVIGLVAWLLFYFVDAWWYHRLLLGAVKHGKELEKTLAAAGIPGFELTKAIGDESPFTLNLGLWTLEVHSPSKIRIFYYTISLLLAVAALALLLSDVDPSKP